MNIRTEITQENIAELSEIASLLSSTNLYKICVGYFLNLDTEWDKGEFNPQIIIVLSPNSTHLRKAILVSHEEFKQAIFAYLMEN